MTQGMTQGPHDRHRVARALGWPGIVVGLALLCAPPCGAADLKRAEEAYRRGDHAEVVRLLTPLAEAGHLEAQYRLGLMYGNGHGVAQDQRTASEWFDKATAALDEGAQFNLGVMYYQGQGLPRDPLEAARWFRKAAERGDLQAQFNLALMYQNGEGVGRDPAEATRWYEQAATQGLKEAQLALGAIYRDGTGVPKDYTRAYLWYALAAKQDDQDAKEAAAERDRLARVMTGRQYSEAIRLMREIQMQDHAIGG